MVRAETVLAPQRSYCDRPAIYAFRARGARDRSVGSSQDRRASRRWISRLDLLQRPLRHARSRLRESRDPQRGQSSARAAGFRLRRPSSITSAIRVLTRFRCATSISGLEGNRSQDIALDATRQVRIPNRHRLRPRQARILLLLERRPSARAGNSRSESESSRSRRSQALDPRRRQRSWRRATVQAQAGSVRLTSQQRALTRWLDQSNRLIPTGSGAQGRVSWDRYSA